MPQTQTALYGTLLGGGPVLEWARVSLGLGLESFLVLMGFRGAV